MTLPIHLAEARC